MGAEVGEHLVQIRTAGAGPAEGDYAAASAEKVPVQYNNKSELVRTVEPGKNTIDFELESKGRIVQPKAGYWARSISPNSMQSNSELPGNSAAHFFSSGRTE